MAKTNLGLVAYCEKALSEKWHYAWGSYGQKATAALVDSLVKQYYDLLRIGDSWSYEPYEAFKIDLPDGSSETHGRIERSGVYWDTELGVFSVNSDVEESTTRTEAISMDYDFIHSAPMPLPNNAKYQATVEFLDINVWYSRIFLGDSDGFGIIWYSDVDSLVFWANQAAYRWRLRGFALWSLGQEDLRLWEALPRQA